MNRKKYGFVFCLLVVIAMISLGTVSIYVNHEEKKEATEQLRVVTSFYPMYVAAMNVTDSCESVTLENLSEPRMFTRLSADTGRYGAAFKSRCIYHQWWRY